MKLVARQQERCRRSSRRAPKPPTLGDLVTTDTELGRPAQASRPAAGRLLPSSDKANGETAAAVATELGPDKRNMFARRPTTSSSNTFTTGGKPRRTDSSEIGRIQHKLTYRVHAEEPAGLRRRPGPAGDPPGDQAGAGRRRPAPTRTPSDLGRPRTRPRCAAAPVGRLHRRLRHGVRHLRERAAPSGQGRHEGPSGSRRSELSRWASTCRSSRCWCWPWCSPRVSLLASKLLAPRSPNRREVGALRVRHRARARSRPSASRCASTWSR